MQTSRTTRLCFARLSVATSLFVASWSGAAGAQEMVQQIPAASGSNMRFGAALAMDATTLVVGDYERARNLSTCEIGYGGVSIYKKTNNVWQLSQSFVGPSTASESGEEWYGHWLSLKNNVLLVGANREDGPTGTNAGAFFVYRRSSASANFALVGGKVIAPNATSFNNGSGPPMTPVTNGTLIANHHLDKIYVWQLGTSGVTLVATLTLPVPSRTTELFLTDSNVLLAKYRGDGAETFLAWRISGTTVTSINMSGVSPWTYSPVIMSGDGNRVLVVNVSTFSGTNYQAQLLDFTGGVLASANTLFSLPIFYSDLEPSDVVFKQDQGFFISYPDFSPNQPETFIAGYKYYAGSYNPAGAIVAPGLYSQLGTISSDFGKAKLYQQGQALAFNGTELAVGDTSSPSPSCPGSNGGSVSIFRMPSTAVAGPGGGTQLQPWLPSATHFLGASVAMNGSFVAAGTPFPSWYYYDQGVTLFKNVGGQWQQAGRFVDGWMGWSPDATINTAFGQSVDITDNYLAIGAYNAFSQSRYLTTGAVYLAPAFNGEYGSGPFLPQIPTPADALEGQDIGAAVALSGTTLAVGAPAWDALAPGSVYVYDLTDPYNPALQAALTPPDSTGNDMFGYSVDVNGDWLLVGAPGNTNARGTSAGAAYLYRRNAPTWSLVTKFLPQSNGSSYLGTDVSLGGSQAAIAGAPSGKVLMLRLLFGSWRTDGEISTGVQHFGASVSVDSTRMVVSSEWENRVYRYERLNGVWTRTGILSNMLGANGTDMKGTSVVVGTESANVGSFTSGAVQSLTFSQVQ